VEVAKNVGYFCKFKKNYPEQTITHWGKVAQSGHPAKVNKFKVERKQHLMYK
jgi:hypothetical protein